MTFRAGLRNTALAILPQQWGDRLLTEKQALWWRSIGRYWHRQHFVDPAPKEWLTTALSKVRQDAGPRPLAILEFGCAAGNNLYTLRQDPATTCTYCGIDINPTAIDFARAHFPSDSFHVGGQRWFIRHASELGSFDLFIASHVLYYIDEENTRLILDAARKVAHYIVVVDRMERFFAGTGLRTAIFSHPYQSICDAAGMKVVQMEATSAPYGYFVACTGR